jgi:two-component system KDP operon response regulator KdpE
MPAGTVLVVDDEPAMGRLLQLQLGMEGFEVLATDNAEEAIALTTARRPDLFIVDLVLPGAGGPSLVEHIRGLTDAPIIVMSGYVDAAHKDLALAAGATEFISKPFDGETLAALCHALLTREEQ